ncbi:DUF2828 family protein [Thermoactinomyces sp. DSM 45892]|uniref:DUF2828 family protein n=1 Tax=Thermoactinomyces sp. DSM 45892 TaxID=1882753 RepID=UPI000899EBF8|nr:DUF2828 family protein [Thermoactinomyces sp. DSM 45892]SDX95083.1 protein of unknown function [Thermoactinomyces sp. DSM 45892]
MLNLLRNEFNQAQTANGAVSYRSTESTVLDLFSMGGAYRQRNDTDIKMLFSQAYAEDKLLTMKTLFYLRDIRGGQGERRFFRLSLEHLALHDRDVLLKNLHLIPKFGRWDDLWGLLETPLGQEVVAIVKSQLNIDRSSAMPSLLGKWMPSENASSRITKKYGKILRESLGYSSKTYRKTLSDLRKRIDIVENKMSSKHWHEVEYDKLPSKAGLIYRDAFYRHDEERYRSYLDNLKQGKTKVNANTLYPHEIVGKILDSERYRYWSSSDPLTPQDIQLFEAQWSALPDFIGEKSEDSLVMADCSASMMGTPLNVAISLAMYIAERNKGAFKDHFMSFSSRPNLVKIQGNNIVNKVTNISKHNFVESTNIESALSVILQTAIRNKLPKTDMIRKLYIISDMQFDVATEGAEVHIFRSMERKFVEAGYDLPNLVFWNVNAFTTNVPFTMNEQGVQLVSGFSPSILKHLMNAREQTPYSWMLEVIQSERYAEVSV